MISHIKIKTTHDSSPEIMAPVGLILLYTDIRPYGKTYYYCSIYDFQWNVSEKEYNHVTKMLTNEKVS